MRIAPLALLLALAAAALACEPAAATFPGRNGDIVLTTGAGSRYIIQRISLLRFAPRLGTPREDQVCDVVGSVNSLRCRSMTRGAFTPDGARIAVTVIQGAETALWTLNAGGHPIDRVPLSASYGQVRWAPDESAFVGVRDTGVFVLNRDGSERSLLAGVAQTLMVYQVDGTDFQIRLDTDVPGLHLKSERGPAGDRHQITVQLQPGKLRAGDVAGSIRIRTNDPQFPQVLVPVHGRLIEP